MPRIFISYRREDSADYATAIYNAFVEYFGPDNVFKDIEGIKLGDEFRAIIERELTHSDIALSLIGPKWLTVEDRHGNRRLENPADFVRIENEMAIRHQLNGNIRLIPVLVGGASMPPVTMLPSSLANLPYISGAVLRDTHFDEDLEHLIGHVDEQSSITGSIAAPPPVSKPPRRSMLWVGGILSLLLLFVFGLVLLNPFADRDDTNNRPDATSTSETMVAANPTDTLGPPTLTVSPTDTPLNATDVEETVQSEMVIIQTEARQLELDAETATATAAFGVSQATAEALTRTAAAWTATPSPDTRATAQARLNATGTQRSRDMTTTATLWTATPTPTFTPTPTNTHTPTPTPTLSPLDIAIEGVERNADWQPHVQEFNGVKMVLVPAGCFMMGSEDGDIDEQPVHEVCFEEPYWIDRYEVTQSDFIRLGGTQANSLRFSGDDRPVENITWFEVRNFCEQRGGRLPTEAQWEYAARGPDGLTYPWEIPL